MIEKDFAFIPRKDELCYIICGMFLSKLYKPVSLHYISRLILNEIPEVITAPDFENDVFYVISKKNNFAECKVKRKVMNLCEDIKVSKPEAVTNEIYIMCLEYTCISQLIPKWLIVNKYLIQYQDFIFHKKSINGVQFYITIKNEEIMCLNLSAVIINILPYFQLNQFSDFMRQVYIFPSMKKGKLISVCKDFPDNTIRRDWLLYYGFDLPKNTLICKVSHSDFEKDFEIYPSVCILAESLRILNNTTNSENVIADFLKDLILSFDSKSILLMKNIELKTKLLEISFDETSNDSSEYDKTMINEIKEQTIIDETSDDSTKYDENMNNEIKKRIVIDYCTLENKSDENMIIKLVNTNFTKLPGSTLNEFTQKCHEFVKPNAIVDESDEDNSENAFWSTCSMCKTDENEDKNQTQMDTLITIPSSDESSIISHKRINDETYLSKKPAVKKRSKRIQSMQKPSECEASSSKQFVLERKCNSKKLGAEMKNKKLKVVSVEDVCRPMKVIKKCIHRK